MKKYKFPKCCLLCKNLEYTTDLGEFTLQSICKKHKEKGAYLETPLICFYNNIKIPMLNKKKRYKMKKESWNLIMRNCKYFKRNIDMEHRIFEKAEKEHIRLVKASCMVAWELAK